MQQTDNTQRTDNAPPYATVRLPIPQTLYVAASTYIATYQQQLLEGTRHQVRRSNSYVHVIH
jgi:hypothetical protein